MYSTRHRNNDMYMLYKITNICDTYVLDTMFLLPILIITIRKGRFGRK
nr:ALPV-019 [Albatrosspox virus]